MIKAFSVESFEKFKQKFESGSGRRRQRNCSESSNCSINSTDENAGSLVVGPRKTTNRKMTPVVFGGFVN
jgi:hypothetical protein